MADSDLLRPGEDPSVLDQINSLNGLTNRQVRQFKRDLGFQFSSPTFEGISFAQFADALGGGTLNNFNAQVVNAGGKAQKSLAERLAEQEAASGGGTTDTPTTTEPQQAAPVIAVGVTGNDPYNQRTPRFIVLSNGQTIPANTLPGGYGSGATQYLGMSFDPNSLELLPGDQQTVRPGQYRNQDALSPQAIEQINASNANIGVDTASTTDTGTGGTTGTGTGTNSEGSVDGIEDAVGGTADAPIHGISDSILDAIRASVELDSSNRAEAEFQGQLDTEFGNALSQFTNTLTSRGIDPSLVEPELLRTLNQIRGGIPQGATDFSALSDTSILDNAISTVQGNQRTNFTNQFNQFAPEGFAKNLIGDTADDDIIATLLEEQFIPAEETLQRALARNLLSDRGFNSANQKLTNQRSAAEAQLQEIGGGVLETGRQGLRDFISGGRNQAANFTLGSDFNPSTFQSGLDSRVNDFTGSLEGKIRNATGGTELFDTGSLIQSGRVAAGTENNRGSLFDVLANREAKKRGSQRGLGTEGAF